MKTSHLIADNPSSDNPGLKGIWWSLIAVVALMSVLKTASVAAQDTIWTAKNTKSSHIGSKNAFKSEANTPAQSGSFDVTYYHLTLNLNGVRNPILVGRNRISGKALGRTDTLFFDLSNNLTLDFVSLSSGRILSSTHAQDKIHVVLEETLEAGDAMDLDIVYHGNPESSGFGAFTSIQNEPGKPNTIWTLSEPYGSKEWWPTDDDLTDKADSVRLTVRVPAPMSVASNGVLVNKINHLDGSATFDWLHRYPIAPYLVSLAIGNYDVYQQVYTRPAPLADMFGPASFPIDHYAYKGSDAFQGISPSSGWHLALEMMPVFEDWFGPYPFEKEKYGHAHVTFKGGMEHQTISSMGNIGAELIAHELAHQWFGDKLTPASWKDLWLNEGFATMSEFLIYETDPKYNFLKSFLGDLYYERARQATGTLVLADTTSISEMFDFSRVYAKGYFVLRMIRGIVGDDVFKSILRAYAENPEGAYASVETKDFQQVVEDVSGRSFAAFFDQWVTNGTGFPTYSAAVESIPTDISPFKTRITLSQLQEPNESNVSAFDLPVWLQLKTTTRTLLIQVENSLRVQSHEIDLDAPLVSVEIDPYRWILRGESPVALHSDEGEELPNEFDVSVFPNPARQSFHVQLDGRATGDPIDVRLFDTLGRLVFEQRSIAPRLKRHLIEVNPMGISPGLYVLRVQKGSSLQTKSIIITR